MSDNSTTQQDNDFDKNSSKFEFIDDNYPSDSRDQSDSSSSGYSSMGLDLDYFSTMIREAAAADGDDHDRDEEDDNDGNPTVESVTNTLSRLKVILNTKEQINKAIKFLEGRHHDELKQIGFHAQQLVTVKEQEEEEEELVIQNNFEQFFQKLENNSSAQAALFYLREISFEGKMIFRLNEAKILAKIIKSKLLYHLSLEFHCRVSIEAFQHLISECGIKKTNNAYNRVPQPHKKFDISGTGINYHHVKSLENILMPSLIYSLNLSDSYIRDKGAIALAEMLYENTKLRVLNLNDNKIGVVGAKALGEMLCYNSYLESLNLSRNYIGDEGVKSIAGSLSVNSSLEILSLSEVGCLNEGLLALTDGLTNNTCLKELNLDSNTFKKDDLEGIQALAQSLKFNTSLTEVCLGNTLVDFDCYTGRTISRYLADKPIKFEIGLSADTCLLSSLDEGVSGDAVDGLVGCCSPVLTVDASCYGLRPHHMKKIIDGIRSGSFDVESLRLGCVDINNRCVKFLLEAMIENKASCSITEILLYYVEGLTGVGAKYIVESIPQTNLQKLYLTGVPVSDEGVQQIASYLNDTELTALGLNDVGMKDRGLIALSIALKHNKKLTYLDIDNNDDLTSIGMHALFETMKDYNTTLTEICMDEDAFRQKLFYRQIKFYMDLNYINREKLVDPNCTLHSFFAEILEAACACPSVIYWLLQSRPQILH